MKRRHILEITIIFLTVIVLSYSAWAQTGITKYGSHALYNNTSGDWNTGIGYYALYKNTTGSFNTAIGTNALYSNTTARKNTAAGYRALYLNTTGSDNTATGYGALTKNTTGSYNQADGTYALNNNTTGVRNTANGRSALYRNTTGSYNTANGGWALYYNTIGHRNTANGYTALYRNTTGKFNTATGYGALAKNTTGSYNQADGAYALHNNTTGVSNTANGYGALWFNKNGFKNTAIGLKAGYKNVSGSRNVFIGYLAGYNETGSNKLYIANSSGTPLIYGNFASGRVGIGTTTPRAKLDIVGPGYPNSFIFLDATGGNEDAGLRFYRKGAAKWHIFNNGSATSNNLTIYNSNASKYVFTATQAGKVGIGTSNPLFTLHVNGTAFATGAAGALSDRRHKTNINDLSLDALQVIKELRPVIFDWKEPQDTGMEGSQLGFIAQEVEEVLPEAVLTQDNEEQTKGLKYNALIPLLTKAIQELETKNEALMVENNTLRQEIEQIKEVIGL